MAVLCTHTTFFFFFCSGRQRTYTDYSVIARHEAPIRVSPLPFAAKNSYWASSSSTRLAHSFILPQSTSLRYGISSPWFIR